MATITLSIVKNSDAWTKMRIFRSPAKETVYAAAALADVAISDTYADTTATAGVIYYYGIELYNAIDKTRFNAISATATPDFGPFITQVQANIALGGSALFSGDATLGWIMQASPQSQFPNMPGPVSVKSKFDEIQTNAGLTATAGQPSADALMNACMMDGKVIIVPNSYNFVIGANTSLNVIIANIQKLAAYLKNTPTGSYVDIAGYRYRIKPITKEMLVKYPDFTSIVAANTLRKIPRCFNGSAATTVVYGETDNSLVYFTSNADGTITFSTAGASSSGGAYGYMHVYFELEGAAPSV